MMSAAPSAVDAAPVGPGRFLLVVGPSGAGKDTVLTGARLRLAGDPTVYFPRRIVTRPVSESEDHETVASDTFDAAAGNGSFALWWSAHGLKYGIPRAVDDSIRAGHTVVCNVSRAIIADARVRYARVEAVLITAPAEVLAARLAGRARESDGRLEDRIKRNDVYAGFQADHVIQNAGAPEDAIQALLDIIRA